MKQYNKILLLTIITALNTPHLSRADWWNALNSLFFTPPLQSSTVATFNKTEAYNYINQISASMENALYAHVGHADLNTLKQRVFANINQAEYGHQNYSYAEQRYSKDTIDQLISSAILEYIQSTSYKYAYSRTYDKMIALQIAESMRNNALAIIAQNKTIDFKRLVPFVGQALERAVNDIIENHSQHYQSTNYQHTPAKPSTPVYQEQQYAYAPVKPSASEYSQLNHHSTQQQSTQYYQQPTTQPRPSSPKLFTSSECVVCLEDFGGPVKRIYLKPCGHDMCQACAFDWFFGATQKTECPQCRVSVDLRQLQNDII